MEHWQLSVFIVVPMVSLYSSWCVFNSNLAPMTRNIRNFPGINTQICVTDRPVMKNPDRVKAEAALWPDSYLFSGMAANAGMHSGRGEAYNTSRKTNIVIKRSLPGITGDTNSVKVCV